MGALYAAAAAAFVASALLYYRAAFAAAALCGLAYLVLVGVVVFNAMGPVGATVTTVLLLVAPNVFLLVHAVDAKKGIFLLPTIYAIPLTFFAGALTLAITGLVLLF
ncbi:MAG: hypothetical protein ACYTGN_06345 [Planctomycetota bacterium]|jgi:hypothetical protein